MVSINPVSAISVAAKGQDLNFETRLSAMENTIFKLGSSLENFISANSPSSKSRVENDRRYLANSTVIASLSEIDQSSDDESNYGSPPENLKKKKKKSVGMLLIFVEHQKIYLTSTLICWVQMQKRMTNQVRTVQQMI